MSATKEQQRWIDVKEEKNGYKLGINLNPDVAHLPVENRWKIEKPNGGQESGDERDIKARFKALTGGN